MVLRAGGRSSRAENSDDLRNWLSGLPGGPVVGETVLLACGQHGDERPTWMYVEADAAAGIARRRCLQCGFAVSVLDSGSRWTFPPMWSCSSCGHSIAEVAAGLSITGGDAVSWVVIGARCVGCSQVEGLTDLVLPDAPLASVLVGL